MRIMQNAKRTLRVDYAIFEHHLDFNIHKILKLACICVELKFSGNKDVDSMINMLLSTGPLIGGIVGFTLDNIIPGQ